MPSKKEQQLTNDNIVGQCIGIGLYTLLVTAIIESIGDAHTDQEVAFTKIKAVLDRSLPQFHLNVPEQRITELERQMLERDVQGRVGVLLSLAYRTARENSGLPAELINTPVH